MEFAADVNNQRPLCTLVAVAVQQDAGSTIDSCFRADSSSGKRMRHSSVPQRLRLEHEAQTGEVFGLVVRLRFDLWFHHSLALPFWPTAARASASLPGQVQQKAAAAPVLTAEPIAWLITDLVLDCPLCGWSRRPHALDHVFALSHAAASTLCNFSAALEHWWQRGIPATCGSAWFPEGQVLHDMHA